MAKYRTHSRSQTVRTAIQEDIRSEAEEAPVFTCKTCGRSSRMPGHLCAPAKHIGYFCAYCGLASDDPYHVCSPMLTEMKYVCRTCGRVTPQRDAVCKPVVIK